MAPTTTAVSPSYWPGPLPTGIAYAKCDVVTEFITVDNDKGCIGHNVYNTSCKGYCNSDATTLVTNSTSIDRDCYCCRPDKMELRVVLMTCPDSSMSFYYYAAITSCACVTCGVDPIGNQENSVFSSIVRVNTALGK